MVLRNILKNVFKSQVGSHTAHYEQQIASKLANTDAMKAAATLAHELVSGAKNQYNPADPRTYHLKPDEDDEDAPKAPKNMILQRFLAARAAVTAASSTLINEVKNDLNKKK
eukprot:TRINITY_DN65070_c0_g1_i1.p1 TRINITY_DN65070_c0_g1~~TRINITY_DN65070_c0_g1_i1.p1  ORF type:complete len:120 (-),score=16.00 TRINITY_DN65070_c0_g1_i1:204-539(-)